MTPVSVTTDNLNCPITRRDSLTDPKRQQSCSPIETMCFDIRSLEYKNSNCPEGSACAQWTSSISGFPFIYTGCILNQYCNTFGDYYQGANI